MKEFGERLEDWIRATWQSQRVFAHRVEYSVATINSYCKGRSFPDQVFLCIIHELGADLNALITGNSLESKPHSSSLPHVERLKSWIVKYYGTIPELLSVNAKLLEKMNITNESILKCIYGQVSYDAKTVDFFNAIGCNMHWVMTGSGNDLLATIQIDNKIDKVTDILIDRIQQDLFDKLTESDLAKLSDQLTKKLIQKFISGIVDKQE
ncbi:MAG: hypothetical protein IAE98_00440 [Candidatus Kapabacteria bacterium]|nr:hypothetical protein [Candidatus Kapabacteria bacterium]